MRDGRHLAVHLGFLVALAAVTVVFFTEPLRPVSVPLAALAPTAVVAVALWRGRTPDRRAWWLVLAGLLVLDLHNVQGLVGGWSQGWAPGVDDAATLLVGYVLLISGGLRTTMPLVRSDPGGLIDATVIGLATAGVLWTTLVQPARVALGAAPASQAVHLVQLFLVSVMLGVVVRVGTTSARARGTLGYLAVTIVATLAGTLVDGLSQDPQTGLRTWWVGLCWVVAYLALAAALGHPSILQVSGPATPGRLSTGRVVFLGTALALNPAANGVAILAGNPLDPLAVNVASLLLVPLVLARIALLARLHASAEHRLATLASRDELTGLPNRRSVTQHLAALVDRVAAGESLGAAVLFCDLDDFKEVNDEHGHPVGDRLLTEVATRLRSAVRPSDLVGRFGGDEFVLVLEGDPDAARSAGLGALERVLDPPVILDGVVASARASIGSAVARPGEQTTVAQLLSAADASMYRVKHARRSDPRLLGERT